MERGMTKKIESWHRRHAVIIASQLPDKEEDALAALEAARYLVTGFLAEPNAEKPTPVVVMIGGKGSNECA
jgi:hypothetical protein